MRAISNILGRSAFVLALSMSALPNLVNAQAQSLTSVNTDNTSTESDLKISVKETNVGMSKLIETVLRTGSDSSIGNNLASIIGLPKAMPVRKKEIVTSKSGKNHETSLFYVIYDKGDGSDAAPTEKRAVCAYIVKANRSGLNNDVRFFRIDLNGKLEKAVLSQSKFDESGKGVRGSGVKTDLDIDSPEVRKTFDSEMKFWVKDWLKKEQKLDTSKATASAAKPDRMDTASAAAAQATP